MSTPGSAPMSASMLHTVGHAKPASAPSGVTPDYLTHTSHFIAAEAELGSSLNHSLSRGQRADFRYLLALLSDNVVEHSAVTELHNSDTVPAWNPPFAVAPQVPLQSRSTEFDKSVVSFAAHRTLWRLQQALQPAGLHPINNPKHIPAQVVENCAHYVQQRLSNAAKHASASLDKDTPGKAPSPENVTSYAELLDVIEQSRGAQRVVA